MWRHKVSGVCGLSPPLLSSRPLPPHPMPANTAVSGVCGILCLLLECKQHIPLPLSKQDNFTLFKKQICLYCKYYFCKIINEYIVKLFEITFTLTQSFIHSRPVFFYPALYSGPSYLPLPFLLLSSSYLTLPTYISHFLPACSILLLTSSCLWRFLPASSYLPVSFLLLMPSYLTFPTQLFLPTFDASTSLFLPSSWPLPT